MPERDNEELITWIHDQIKAWKSGTTDWRKNTTESYDFVASKQWDQIDSESMKSKGRVPIVFNRIARVINAVTGLELQNRQEVRYIPRELGDAQVNEILTHAAKWVRDNCDAEDEESEAFQDTLICGMGWTETWMDYESDAEGKICIDRIDPLEMGWDISAKKRNIDDARCVWRFRKIPTKEYKERWPDAELTSFESFDNEVEQPHDAEEAKYYRENNEQIQDSDKGKITVVQFQWWDRDPVYMVGGPGKLVEFPEAKFNRLKEKFDQAGIKYVKRTRRVYRQAFLNGSKDLLESGDAPCKDHFSFRCITGLRNRNDNTWFGIVELMKDPQRWANKWLSQIMYIISTNSKGGLLAEDGAFANPRKAEEDWGKPDSIIHLQSGGLQKVQEKGQAQYPQGLDRLLQYALESINDVPGVNLELMGLADRAQAGYLEAQRKQAGVTILAIFFDSLRRYRKEQGRVLAHYIREYISDGRLIRVLGNNGQEQYLPLLRQDDTMMYDVIVDDAPTSPNMKERTFGILSELVPQLLQAGIPIPPEILDYTPLPDSLVQKWKGMLPKPGDPPPPDPKVEAERQKLQLEVQKAQLDAQIEQERTALKADLDQQKLDQEMVLKREQMIKELEIKREQMLIEASIKKDLEDARVQKMSESITGGLETQTKAMQDQTGQMAQVFAELIKEMQKTNEDTRRLMTAEREVYRTKDGNKRSRIVLQ